MNTYGSDYCPILDGPRIKNQHKRIRDLMLDGVWRTYQEINKITGDPENSIGSQLRHLRKDQFGGYQVIKRRRKGAGTREFAVFPPIQDGQYEIPLNR